MTGLTRRGIVGAAPAVIVAAKTSSSALAIEPVKDAELLALRPIWIATRAAFEDALNELSAAAARYDAAAAPELPDYHTFEGTLNEFCAKKRRIRDLRDALEVETGLKAAHEAEIRTSDADSAMVERISAIPARTKAGIRFKKEVLDDWSGCIRNDMEGSILADLLAMGGFDA